MTVGWLPRGAAELFGEGAVAAERYQVLTVDVPAAAWERALRVARDELGCAFLDWLSAVDEPDRGLFVCAHLVALGRPPRKLLLRTALPREGASLATATRVYRGAAWHERETAEMFGVTFTGHPDPKPLLLPEGFEGHPLRKDFVLAARVAKAWPGAKEPGEPGEPGRAGRAAGPRRRQSLPPGVPDPNEWGPRRGRLAPPATPASPAGPAAGAAPGGQEPPGSGAPRPGARPRRPRRNRSAAEGSASQRRARAAAPGTPGAGPTPDEPRGERERAAGHPAPRTPDAPWHAGTGAPGPTRGASGRPRGTDRTGEDQAAEDRTGEHRTSEHRTGGGTDGTPGGTGAQDTPREEDR